MEVRYEKKYSKELGRDMEYKVYGDHGRPVLAFASQDGRFYDYENFDMVLAISKFIDDGQIRLVCADSIDKETWSDTNGDPRHRIELQEKWFHYIVDELIPSERKYNDEKFIVTGCSMGGFHAANTFFRRPDLFDTLISLSGIYYAAYFFGSYRDDLTYANSPQDYLWNMPDDHPYWQMYRERTIILCVGQGAWEDDLLASTREMDRLLHAKHVPAWIDYWGHDVSHDWCWWRKQIVYFLDKVLNGNK